VSGQLALAAGLTAVAVLVLLAGALVLRRVLITRRGGVIECALRLQPGGTWRHGLAEYRAGQLYWHRSMSLRLRPHAAFDRSDLAVISSRVPRRTEDVRLGPGMVVVQCQGLLRHRGRPPSHRVVELGMTQAALMGLLSWLESSPVWSIRRAGLTAFACRADRRRPPDYRSPPGFQSKSPCGSLTLRPRMNNRSDSRFRYLAVSGFMLSG